MSVSTELLTTRWTRMRHHRTQHALRTSKARFKVVPAGRRSGKTEIAKREAIKDAIREAFMWPDWRCGFGAPTRAQAKDIYWEDIKLLVPRWMMLGQPAESELKINLITGGMLQVLGMDVPARVEGRPWNRFILDEYANMKREAWTHHVRPALSDRNGSAWLIGVPEGRNHYYDVAQYAKQDQTGEWELFWWPSADILPASEIEAARRELDELTFQQEYEASFVTFQGRAYYPWHEHLHSRWSLNYDKKQPLNFCFDFNVAPGTAAVVQEQVHPGLKSRTVTGVIGEVWIPQNSNTERVCRKLIKDWGDHEGRIMLYGDATGGAKGTAKLSGSDWDIIKRIMYDHYGRDRVYSRVPESNPTQRARVNAVNSRLKTMSGEVHLLVDPAKAPHVVLDFEGTRLIEGGVGEIDKTGDPNLTHLTDGIGYYVAKEFPVRGTGTIVEELSIYA